MDEDLYMSDPKSKSIAALIEALAIVAKYAQNGLEERWPVQAEHDVLYLKLDLEKVPEDSEDGRRLIALGFHAEEDVDSWAYFT